MPQTSWAKLLMSRRLAEAVPGLPLPAGTTARPSVTNRVKANALTTLARTTAATHATTTNAAEDVVEAAMTTAMAAVVVGTTTAEDTVVAVITIAETEVDMAEDETSTAVDVTMIGGTEYRDWTFRRREWNGVS
jgi:hypothetical protein